MKVSEAVNQLKIGDTVWVEGKVGKLDKKDVLPFNLYLDYAKPWISINDEISLTEPSEKVEIPEYVAEWIEFCKERGISLHTAMNPHSELLRRIEKTYKEMRKWLTGANYKKNEEIFARAWLDGFTVKSKRWVVKNEEGYYFVAFSKYAKTPFEGVFSASVTDLVTFDDKSKAEAVAALVDGSVEEV